MAVACSTGARVLGRDTEGESLVAHLMNNCTPEFAYLGDAEIAGDLLALSEAARDVAWELDLGPSKAATGIVEGAAGKEAEHLADRKVRRRAEVEPVTLARG